MGGSPSEFSPEHAEVLALVSRLTANALKAGTAILRLADESAEGRSLVIRYGKEEPGIFATVEETLAALTRQEAIPILIPDLRQDARFASHAPARPVSAISAPLLQHRALIGTLCLFEKIPGAPDESAEFDERDVALLATLATEASIAIENARLFRQATDRAGELAALGEIGQAITGRLELPNVLEAIAAGAMRLLGSQYAQILLWDDVARQLRYGAAIGAEAERVKVQVFADSRGVNATVARTREPMILDDYQASPYALPEFSDVVATLTTPVMFGDRLLGILHSHTTQPGKRFTPDNLRLLQMLGTQAAIAIENARLYEEARVRSARFRALSELSRKVSASLDIQQVFDYAVQVAVDLLDLALARLWVWREGTGLLHVEASAGDPALLPPPRETFAPGEGVIGTVFRTLQVATLSDPESDPQYLERDWAQRMGVRKVASVPLHLGERAVGVLSVALRTARAFRPDDIELLTSFAQHTAIAIENARLFREKERLAVEEILRLRRISILSEIGSVMQETMQLDAVLRVILTGATYGGGLGFNRAMLLLVDESRRILAGRMGVGPSSAEEAGEIWKALDSQRRPLSEVVAEWATIRGKAPESPLNRLARSLKIPLQGRESVLARAVLEARAIRVRGARSDPAVHPKWEGRLDVDEFACAPLMAKGKVVGVIVVDNKFNEKPISDEDLEFLSAFATHAGLAVENARVYTSLGDANREIQRSHHQLLQQERLAALGEMAAHVVHEIRNPLVAVGGFARRLAQRLASREPEGQYAQIIAREVDRLERIVQDVRGLSREINPTLADTDLHLLLQDCLVLFAEKIALQQVSVRLDLAEPWPMLRLDPTQIKQAIVNLVANALEAMLNGGTLTLATQIAEGGPGEIPDQATSPSGKDERARQGDASHPKPIDQSAARPAPGGWATLSVADTGGGIPQEILGEVFDPFFTTKEVGTGLGLSLVRRVVRAHGGHVEVNNRLGEGVTFRLWLPVATPAGAEDPAS
jgi:two-component system sensor histidine kinase HydH